MSLDDPSEKIAWLYPPELGGWEYLIAYRSTRLWTVYHETYALCACRNLWGQSWRYRGRTYTRPGPGMMLMEPGELHRTLAVPYGAEFKVVQIPPTAVAGAAVELGVTGLVHLARADTDDPKLTAAVWRLGELAEQGGASRLEVQTLQTLVLRRMLMHAERPPRSERADDAGATRRARDYLCDHRCDAVTLDELAAVAGISRFRLLRAFKKRYGVPPHAFQIQLRIEQARTMLRGGIHPAQVSAEMGFYDQSHFGRHFRRIVGVTPIHYAYGCRTVPSASLSTLP